MFYFKDLKIKVGNMKKEQDFSCYGFNDESSEVIFQSDSRIFKVDLKSKKLILSKRFSSGAYFHHLNKILGAKDFELTNEQLEKILEYRKDYLKELKERSENKVRKYVMELKQG